MLQLFTLLLPSGNLTVSVMMLRWPRSAIANFF